MKKVARNDPCSCGSGKKYKQCCLKRDEGLASSKRAETASIPTAIQEATEHHQAGRLPQAETIYQKILQVEPDHPDALHYLGVLAHQVGRNEVAVEFIGRAINVNPSSPSYYSNLGAVLLAQGKMDEAAESYRKALLLRPDYAEAHYNLGIVLKNQGKLDEEVEHYRHALTLKPDYVDAHNNLGAALKEQGRLDESVEHYQQALSIQPDFAEAHSGLGVALQMQGRLDEAVEHYCQALTLKPGYAEAHNNLGAALQVQGKFDAAIESYHKALLRKPDFAEAHSNLGNALLKQGKLDEAVKHCLKALSINPDFAEARNHLGNALLTQNEFEAAIACYRQALTLQPGFPTAQQGLGYAQLACGQLVEGWNNHEFRIGTDLKRFTHQPYWAGENLDGKSILVWGEQGIGDEIMFASMYSEIIARSGRCVIECASKLVPLFTRSFPDAQIIPKYEPPHPATQAGIDFQCAAGSLARWLRPSLENFPHHNIFLKPDPERVAYWRTRLAELGPEPKIGFCWRSSLMTEDRALQYTTLDQWEPIFTLPGVHFINMQYGECVAELNEARKRFGVPLHAFTEVDMFNDLDETAALIQALDMVISPNAAGEMAAALGVNAWRMCYGVSWDTHGTDQSYWFPALRYFNRRWDQTWNEIIERVSRQLKSHVWK